MLNKEYIRKIIISTILLFNLILGQVDIENAADKADRKIARKKKEEKKKNQEIEV